MSTTVFRSDWQRRDGDGARPRPGVRTKPGPARQVYLPPGWPDVVPPPVDEGWESAAVSFLLDCCPADYRGYELLRRQPVVLARLAAQFVDSQVRASRDAIGTARAGLGGLVDAPVLEGTVDVLQTEEARLVRQRRAVQLVEEALRGEIFIPKL